MNLTDLREELTAHADDLGPSPDVRAGVAAKVLQIRRRRASATGAVATLAVAALAVGVLTSVGRPAPSVPAGSSSSAPATVTPMIGADGMPYRPVPDAPGDVVKGGLRYRAQVGDDRLAAGAIGDPGQARLTLAWTPTTTHVSFGAECYLPGVPDTEARRYLVSAGIEGKAGFLGTQCSGSRATERDLPAGGGIPGEPGQGWPELTVGQVARVRVQLLEAKTMRPASVAGAVLTGAAYELGVQQPVEDEAGRTVANLPTVVEHQGYRYRLAGIATGALASGPLPELGVPDSKYAGVAVPDGPFLLSWGSAGKDLTGSVASNPNNNGLRLNGLTDTEVRGFGSWGVAPVPAGTTRSVRLVADGPRPDHGTAFIVVYTLTP